jgi:hypothetical protein
VTGRKHYFKTAIATNAPVRDRYLTSLRLGKQAPEYKRAKQHIEAFIKELKASGYV